MQLMISTVSLTRLPFAVFGAYYQYRSATVQAEHRHRRDELAHGDRPHDLEHRHGRGPVGALVEVEDRMGIHTEVYQGRDDREVVQNIAREPIRPGTQTRIGGHPQAGGDSGKARANAW